MEYIIYVSIGVLINILIGAVCGALLDTENVWLDWLDEDKTSIAHIIFCSIWPISAILMIIYKIQYKRDNN